MTKRLDNSGMVARALLVLAACVGFFVTASPVRADDPEPEVSASDLRWNRLLAVELGGAVDGPYGVGSGLIVISPVSVFGIELGGGVSRDGGRVGGGLRLTLPQDHFALQMRVGITGGPQTWDTNEGVNVDPGNGTIIDYGRRRRWDFQGSFYSDIGLQYRLDNGLYFSMNLGVDQALSGVSDTCELTGPAPSDASCSLDGQRPIRLYAGLNVGYAFDFHL